MFFIYKWVSLKNTNKMILCELFHWKSLQRLIHFISTAVDFMRITWNWICIIFPNHGKWKITAKLVPYKCQQKQKILNKNKNTSKGRHNKNTLFGKEKIDEISRCKNQLGGFSQYITREKMNKSFIIQVKNLWRWANTDSLDWGIQPSSKKPPPLFHQAPHLKSANCPNPTF